MVNILLESYDIDAEYLYDELKKIYKAFFQSGGRCVFFP